jgi:hypothetical protein
LHKLYVNRVVRRSQLAIDPRFAGGTVGVDQPGGQFRTLGQAGKGKKGSREGRKMGIHVKKTRQQPKG